MKNLFQKLSAFALLVFISASCTPDPCKDVVCGVAGVCTEGICICDNGFEQDATGQCNTEWLI